MDDSWPGARPADELSDSSSSHAAELDRTLRALEAVETFRAEAAALRAELHAAGSLPQQQPQPQPRRPVLPSAPAIDLSEATWRLIIEAGILLGVAFAAWAGHLGKVAIVIVMAGAWVFVAILEAAAFKRSQTVIPARPPVPARRAPVEHTSVMPPQPAAVPEAPEELAQALAPRSRFARLRRPKDASPTAR